MGAEQSDQSNQKLKGFCCNTNLCNNDLNVESKQGIIDPTLRKNHRMPSQQSILSNQENIILNNSKIESNSQMRGEEFDQYGNRVEQRPQTLPYQPRDRLGQLAPAIRNQAVDHQVPSQPNSYYPPPNYDRLTMYENPN